MQAKSSRNLIKLSWYYKTFYSPISSLHLILFTYIKYTHNLIIKLDHPSEIIRAVGKLDQRKKEKEEMTLDFLDDTQVEYEQAVSLTKFGKFHFFLLAVCGLIYLNTAVGITIISFVLPSATCGEQHFY